MEASIDFTCRFLSLIFKVNINFNFLFFVFCFLNQKVNVVEVRTVLEAQEMRLLLRGHIVLSVHAKRAPDVRLRGPFGPRIACDLFDSLVTTGDALQSDAPAAGEVSSISTPSSVSSAGLAWMYIGKTGSIHYRIKLRGLQSKVTRVTIESTGSSKANKKPKIVEDVTDMLSFVDMKNDGNVYWINGTVSRLAAKDLELLYEGELYVNVATEQFPVSEIRGKLVPRLAGESHLATENGPVLLNPVGNSTATNRAALGWVHVDKECNFHYDVAVTSSSTLSSSGGRPRDQLANSLTVLELVDIPRISIEHQNGGTSSPGSSGIMLMDGSEPSNYGEIPFMPNIRLLEEFSGYQVENSVADLNKLSLARMEAGVAYLKLTEAPVIGTGTPGAQFQGWLTNVHVPGSCLPIGMGLSPGGDGLTGEQSILGVQGYVFDRAQDDNNEIPMATTRCFYEGKLYDDGKAWTAEHDRCMMCSCQRGRVVCDPVVCPALNCTGPSAAIIHPPGDCCPQCESNSNSSIFSFKILY
jgi:chordin